MAMERSTLDSKKRRAEEAACHVVVAVRSAELRRAVEAEHWDIPPRQGVHDYWVRHGDTREALEVTTLAMQDTITNLMHWQKRGPGFDASVAGLTCSWSILIDQEIKAYGVRAHLAEWLVALEAEGVTSTGRWDTKRVYAHPVTRALVRAGVMEASTVPGPPAGLVTFFYASSYPSRPAGDPNYIAAALTEILKLERHQGDAAKLGRSAVDERHLFMWVDLSRWDVARAFEAGMPDVAPEIDANITTVWLAVHTGNRADVLRWSTSAGWQGHHVTI